MYVERREIRRSKIQLEIYSVHILFIPSTLSIMFAVLLSLLPVLLAPFVLSDCVVGGCSDQLCTNSSSPNSDTFSTCEFTDSIACYSKTKAPCTVQKNGICGFTNTSALYECLKLAKSSNSPEFGDFDGKCEVRGCSEQLTCSFFPSGSSPQVCPLLFSEYMTCYSKHGKCGPTTDLNSTELCSWQKDSDLRTCLSAFNISLAAPLASDSDSKKKAAPSSAQRFLAAKFIYSALVSLLCILVAGLV